VFLDSDDETYWLVKDTAARRQLRLKSRVGRKIFEAEGRKEEENGELTDVQNSAFQTFSFVELSSRLKHFTQTFFRACTEIKYQ
jgi:hypothetical protein